MKLLSLPALLPQAFLFLFLFFIRGAPQNWNHGPRCSWRSAMLYLVQKAQERLTRKMSSFSGTGRSTNSIAWKRWFLSGTSEYFSENFDGEAINWSGVVNVHCMQMNLVLSMRFIFGGDWKNAPCSSRFWSLALIFVYLYTRPQSLSNKI